MSLQIYRNEKTPHTKYGKIIRNIMLLFVEMQNPALQDQTN